MQEKSNKKTAYNYHPLSMKRTIVTSVIALSVFVITSPLTSLAQWQEPSQLPPGYSSSTEIPTLLNGGSLFQHKLGSLIIGSSGGNSKLCLNASSSGANDATTCVSNWTDAIGLSGSYVRLSTVSPDGTNYPGNYLVQDTGYIRIKGDQAKNQLYSFYVEAGASPAVDGSGFGSRAFFAVDPYGSSTIYAGYLSGNVRIENTSQDTWLCLNSRDTDISAGGFDPVPGRGCIDSWLDAAIPPTAIGFVTLQKTPVMTSDIGRSAVSKTGFMGSGSAGSTFNLPLTRTCGDGICSSNTNPPETPTSCMIDCSEPPQPSFSITAGNGRNYITGISATLPTECTGGGLNCLSGNLLVIRRLGGPPTFLPQQGTDYTGSADPGGGQYFGDNYVVYGRPAPYGIICGGGSCPIVDTPLNNGQIYYYHVYQGTEYPRFGTPLVTFVQPSSSAPGVPPVHLSVAVNGNGTVTGPGISCSTVDSASNEFLPSTQQGTNFTGWESPTSTSIARSNPTPGQGFNGTVLRWDAVGSDPNRRDWARTADISAASTLAAPVQVSHVTVTLVNAASFPNAGEVNVQDGTGDIFSYTGKSGNILTGVTGISFPHSAGAVVTLRPFPDAHVQDFGLGNIHRISFSYRSSGTFSIRDRDAIIANIPANTGVAKKYTIDYLKATGGWTDPRFMVYLGTTAAWVEMDDMKIQTLADCDENFSPGSSVILDAGEAVVVGWQFVGWSGDCTGSNPICVLSMNNSKNVYAQFAPI